MLKIKVFGIGAAGNRAAIRLIESKVIPRNHIMLLNSTDKDVPNNYRDDFFYEFGDIRGCGKERELAHDMMIKALHNNEIPLDDFLDSDDKFYIIVSSTEGGTGSGSSVLLGEYLQEITGQPVHMVALTGFEDDLRGLKNTVDWFNSLNKEFLVQVISNKKCLQFTDNNRKRAESYANDIFVKRVTALTGKNIIPSEDNMDDTDLFKLSAIPGYVSIETINLERIKNESHFNEIVKEMFDRSVSFETEIGVQRLGVIINASNKTVEAIDNSYKLIKDRYGFPKELFTHTQNSNGLDDSITVIASGLKLPIDEIKSIYTKFKKQMEKIDKEDETFFDTSKQFNTNIGTGFDVGVFAKTQTSKDMNKINKGKGNFFSKFGLKVKTDSSDSNNVAKTEVKIGGITDDL